MNRGIKHLLDDFIFVAVMVMLAVGLAEAGAVAYVIGAFSGAEVIAVFLAGLFFTSAFTTPISIVFLGNLAQSVPLPTLAVVGAVGAMLGDFVIFKFVRDRLQEDVRYVMSRGDHTRIRKVFHTKLVRQLVPFLGALVIASPLPDEIGIAMMGLSKMRTRLFLPISFIFNAIGILAIGWVAMSL